MRRFIVSKNEKLTPDIFRLVLKSESPIFDFKPGQFALLYSKDQSIKRPFSIASSPQDKEKLEFFIKIKGNFTTNASYLKEGDKIFVSGPYGVFIFNKNLVSKAVLIAAGVGIAPMFSIMRYVKDKKLSCDLTFFYSVKTKNKIILPEEIKKLTKEIHLKPTITLTQEKNKEFENGRIDKKMFKKYLSLPAPKTHFFICGSKEFAEATKQNLIDLGIEEKFIILEKF